MMLFFKGGYVSTKVHKNLFMFLPPREERSYLYRVVHPM